MAIILCEMFPFDETHACYASNRYVIHKSVIIIVLMICIIKFDLSSIKSIL